MTISIAQIRDPASAEFVKGLALQAVSVDERIMLLRAALSLSPEDTGIAAHLGSTLVDNQYFDAALTVLKAAWCQKPRDPHLISLLAVTFVGLNAAALAVELFELCRTVCPNYPNLAFNLETARKQSSVETVAGRHRRWVKASIEEARASHAPTIAACMIVKNESEFIRSAIESVRDAVDEIVVVDTGSTDDTVQIAQRAGARVHHFSWVNDFSAARNASLDYATSDWVLILDADERLTKNSHVALKAVVENHHYDDIQKVFCVQIKNYTRAGVFQSDGFSGRLFRRMPEMRFEGRVHEEVGRHLGTDYRLDIVFEHFGADPDVIAEKGKDQRNLELLRHRIAEQPDDLVSWFYLASQHWIGKRIGDASKAFERVVRLYQQDPSRFSPAIVHIPVAYSYVGLIRSLMLEQRLEAAARFGDIACASMVGNPDVLYQSGLAYLYIGRFHDAITAFDNAKRAKPAGFGRIGMHDPSIIEWRAEKMLGDAYYAAEEYDKAFETYLTVIERTPETDPDYIVMTARLVEMASSNGEFDALLKFASSYLQRKPEEIDIAIQVVNCAAADETYWTQSLNLLKELEAINQGALLIPDFLSALAQLYQLTGDMPSATKYLWLLGERVEQPPQFWIQLGQLLTQQDDFTRAQEAFEKAQGLLQPSDV